MQTIEIGTQARSSRIVLLDEESAYAIIHPAVTPDEVRALDARLLTEGFELMDEDECPAELTPSGSFKVWAARVGG